MAALRGVPTSGRRWLHRGPCPAGTACPSRRAPARGCSPPLLSARSRLRRGLSRTPCQGWRGCSAGHSISLGWLPVPGLLRALRHSRALQEAGLCRLSVRLSCPRYLLPCSHCSWQGAAGDPAAGPGQPALAEPSRLDQQAESPSGRASPGPSSKSLLLIKGINWHAACLFKEAAASAVPGGN